MGGHMSPRYFILCVLITLTLCVLAFRTHFAAGFAVTLAFYLRGFEAWLWIGGKIFKP